MFIFETVAELRQWLEMPAQKARTTGFAPTMGALHDGHLELVRMSKRAGDLAVASIFVNPTQFNDPKDLEKYPRMPEKDIALLRSAQCDALFMPPVEEVYPPGEDLSLHLDFHPLDRVMEGEFRPGHFAGMTTVVNRLLDIVRPDRLYMGQKDFQQFTIVGAMLKMLNSDVKLIMCPTKREPDGLAMSSRNLRLSPEMRAASPVIYQTLQWIKKTLPESSGPAVEAEALRRIAEAGLLPQYVSVADGNTLQKVNAWSDSDYIVVCAAAFAGDIRLIDNIILKGTPTF